METLLGVLLSYLISMAAGMRNEAIFEKRRKKLQQKLKKEASALQAIQDCMSLKEQLRLVGTETARLKPKAGITHAEKPLFDLLMDEIFQSGISRWLVAWRPQEKKEAEAALSEQIVKALERGGASKGQIEEFKTEYFGRIEKVVFNEPVLANWRFSLALDAAFERLDELEAVIREEGLESRLEVQTQHKETRLKVSEMAARNARQLVKRFTLEQQRQAIDRYRELALESYDIIDLANLPESDRHIATKKLALRRLYVPLRVKVEVFAFILDSNVFCYSRTASYHANSIYPAC